MVFSGQNFQFDSRQNILAANNFKPAELFGHIYLQNTDNEEFHNNSVSKISNLVYDETITKSIGILELPSIPPSGDS